MKRRIWLWEQGWVEQAGAGLGEAELGGVGRAGGGLVGLGCVVLGDSRAV